MVRFVDSGDESDVGTDDGLAPVTPLFGGGGARSYPTTAAEVQRALEDRLQTSLDAPTSPRSAAQTWTDPIPEDVTPLPPDVTPTSESAAPIDLAAARIDRASSGGRGRPRKPAGAGAGAGDDADAAATAERGLVKKLRGRQLSVSEAKTYLGQYDLDADAVAAILDAFLERGYLDDMRLAEQVVHSGVDRKGQGRQVIAQSLAKRGVPRDVADAALAELPDDDAERALEFARSKAGSLRGLERDVALRRLAGQLARRGYGGSMALNAARTALEEAMRPAGRVRFEES
ncbi:regulatory protein RecX [Microbacterium sp. B35-04]|uniref:regulatory protein RecX n=1 Tax=Microbacterium sp. B35-04 TaxID=1961716 RepID=UPI0013D854DC|nr:regulatory protein RecX [Microbacterium sp. B35-04]